MQVIGPARLYSVAMARSKVAETLRTEQMRDVLAMTPAERVELAFALGERDLAFFMAANGLSREEALAEIERSRQTGRRYSRCIDELPK
jgi:hypothetical protein